MKLEFPIIDLHTHLRNNIPLHTKTAKNCGIDVVVYMAKDIFAKQQLKEKLYLNSVKILKKGGYKINI